MVIERSTLLLKILFIGSLIFITFIIYSSAQAQVLPPLSALPFSGFLGAPGIYGLPVQGTGYALPNPVLGAAYPQVPYSGYPQLPTQGSQSVSLYLPAYPSNTNTNTTQGGITYLPGYNYNVNSYLPAQPGTTPYTANTTLYAPGTTPYLPNQGIIPPTYNTQPFPQQPGLIPYGAQTPLLTPFGSPAVNPFALPYGAQMPFSPALLGQPLGQLPLLGALPGMGFNMNPFNPLFMNTNPFFQVNNNPFYPNSMNTNPYYQGGAYYPNTGGSGDNTGGTTDTDDDDDELEIINIKGHWKGDWIPLDPNIKLDPNQKGEIRLQILTENMTTGEITGKILGITNWEVSYLDDPNIRLGTKYNLKVLGAVNPMSSMFFSASIFTSDTQFLSWHVDIDVVTASSVKGSFHIQGSNYFKTGTVQMIPYTPI